MNTAAMEQDGATCAGGSPPAAHAVGQGAMWVFIVGDLYIFGGWFMFYLVWRQGQQALFQQSQAYLDQTLGMVNTLILLLSSWFVASAVHAARDARFGHAVRHVLATMLCGVVFFVAKLYEWQAGIAGGHTFTANDFFMFYYFLTGIHLFHVLCGFIVLAVMIRNMRTPRLRSPVVIENCAAYWHMVDLLWVLIFALLYLMR